MREKLDPRRPKYSEMVKALGALAVGPLYFDALVSRLDEACEEANEHASERARESARR